MDATISAVVHGTATPYQTIMIQIEQDARLAESIEPELKMDISGKDALAELKMDISVKNTSLAELKMDISGKDPFPFYEISVFKPWIKLIPQEKTILFEEYNRKNYFVPIADIVTDGEIHREKKKRNTVVQFVPLISKEAFTAKEEWLYILTICGRIVKVGGTRTGLQGRVGSYLCGHHIKERGKSGDCSKTNAFIYNTLDFYLSLGCNAKMYGYKLPQTTATIDLLGKATTITVQTYHAYESTMLEDYKKQYGDYPVLSDNCDPTYK